MNFQMFKLDLEKADLMDVSLSELWELVIDREAWRATIHGVTKSRTRLSNWTELNWGTTDQIANICWIIEKAREFKKNIYFCFIDYAKDFACVGHNKLWKILQEMGIPDHLPASCETCMQVKNQQWEPNMEQQTGSKLGKEYVKAVYCCPAYLTSMQSTSCQMPGWMKHKLESRLPGEISITSDSQMTPPLWQKAKN